MRSCFLCGFKSTKYETSPRAYHRFPKDLTIRSVWLNFCNLNEIDKVDTLFICSAHFTPNDYTCRQGNDTGIQRLKRRAVPSVKIKRAKKTKDYTFQEPDMPAIAATFVSPDEVENEAFQADVSNGPACMGESEDPLAPTTQGNLTEIDFSTPQEAKKHFHVMVDTINKRDKTIKHCQRKNKELQKELNTLYILLTQLKQNNFITQEGERLLNQHLNGVIKDENC